MQVTPDASPPGQVVLVFGATGTIGRGAVQAGLDDPAVGELRAAIGL